ncbi:FAD-dependent oxidoreductase [Candidatus Woesearchaeota archaeon]|nr:FAD-dependent oxidoreductase [Candidatus Woesearchaeota archaeon]
MALPTVNTPPRFVEYKAEVISVEDPIADHRIIRFKLLEPDTIDFVPGQFVQVIIEGIPHPSSFSIASSPQDKNEIELAYHKVGRVTGAMSMMRPGAQCTLRGPLGRFTFSAEDGNAVALAGGVGITPFISALRFIRDLRLPNKYAIFYSAKTKDGLLYFDELKEIDESHNNLDVIFTTTREASPDWAGETRRVDAAMITSHVPDYKERTYYICGPKPFIDGMIELLKGIDIPDEQIKRELW